MWYWCAGFPPLLFCLPTYQILQTCVSALCCHYWLHLRLPALADVLFLPTNSLKCQAPFSLQPCSQESSSYTVSLNFTTRTAANNSWATQLLMIRLCINHGRCCNIFLYIYFIHIYILKRTVLWDINFCLMGYTQSR